MQMKVSGGFYQKKCLKMNITNLIATEKANYKQNPPAFLFTLCIKAKDMINREEIK